MAAAREFLDGAGMNPAAATRDHARTFADSVRDLFANFPQPWNIGGAPPSAASGANWPGASGLGATGLGAGALGAGREHQQRWQRIADAGRRIDESQRRLQRLWSDAMREGAAAFAAQLGTMQLSAATPETLRKLYDAWIDCAEEAYSRVAHGEAYCDALAECANAGGEWRKEMQASLEHTAKLLDLPTRSEINTLTLRVQALEKELGALRSASAPKNPAPASPRRTRRKKSP